jgi:uncharacterized membrane protein YedE/YeeE
LSQDESCKRIKSKRKGNTIMEESIIRKALLPWWAAGLLLGLVQILAIGLTKPLGVSTQFVVADAKVIKKIAPTYTENHSLISKDKYQKYGYGWWLDIGLLAGAFLAALLAGKWKVRKTTVWWQANHSDKAKNRFITGFIGGFLILLGARIAHGCTSGQFASGWAQLSLSVLPFTITLFGFGMLTAYLVYPKVPEIEK